VKELWNNLDLHIQVAIEIAAFIGASTLILVTLMKAFKFLSGGFDRVAWLFNEQHDHKVIKDSLSEIQAQLTNNGGTSLKDAVDRIEHKQDFLSVRMQTHLHTNSKAIFETDENGLVTYVNRAYTRMTGLSAHEVQREGWVNVIQPTHRERITGLWFKAVASRRDFDEIVPFVKPDGTEYNGHATAYVIRNDAGKMLGHIGEVVPE
jgi:PAS domain S-box-containing protein